ncbi:dTDP-4-dehydrorhamnose reductase [Lentzea aerocolonigenes]|uniref:dTDP-4-dehydrorhamnose reductase n=1 Tax=Lentzea aerocolonigenes TaxID=68170 RepID=UPI0004C380EE|nr:dTDP-4-dehydrorhamnose reductase [Lentzea aerocolonigenes]MCP2250015.1 dTDP-4-dehydrorhamnose reductase [Lentzea aerocolonigenes]
MILVPGGRGQLGHDLAALSSDVRALSSSDLDVTAVSAADLAGASAVINCAAYTAVDAAETDEDRAFAVNAVGPGLLAEACASLGIPLIHVSTDYVFSGDGTRPYEPSDPVGPKSAYGRTKLEGERRVLEAGGYVVRTAWVYGVQGSNFVKTMAALESTRPSLSVVDDQVGSPTWSHDLAAGLLELASVLPSTRLLHATGGGETTWFRFAQAIFEELGADPSRVHPCTTADFSRRAPRPAYSVLSGAVWEAAGLRPLPHWRSALAEAFKAGVVAPRTGAAPLE